MTSFIIARAVCGLGAGGMMAMGSIITSDLVPIEIRGTYQAYINIMYGIGAASGAALGGAIAVSILSFSSLLVMWEPRALRHVCRATAPCLL